MSKLVNTRNGVFANEGHGGGVFNYNVAFGSDTPTAAVGAKLRSIDDSVVPFVQDPKRVRELQRTLNTRLFNRGLCLIREDGLLGPATCGAAQATGYLTGPRQSFDPRSFCAGRVIPPKRCAPRRAVKRYSTKPTSGVGVLLSGEDPSYPWKAFGFQTMALQSTMNDNLPDFGKCKITAEGNMGPATCGALDFLLSKGMPFSPNGTCEAMRGSESFRAPANPPCLTTGLPLTPRDDPFRWEEFSSETQRLQTAINTHLSAMERCPITVDGKLGPATCGALAVVKDAGRGGNLEIPIDCDIQREPHVFPGSCPANTPAPPPPVNTPAPPPPVEEEEVAPEPDKKGGMNAFIVLGLLAVAATGLVLATKKKK